jgi:phosphoglycerate dehydrogenase-like enzyme/MoaA/NifB/PqqE/SkfB family radical SAM enzyme
MPEKIRTAVTIRSFDRRSIPEGSALEIAYENRIGGRIEGDELVEAAKGAAGVIAGTERFTRDVLSRLPDLKVISRVGVGTDSIDMEAAKEMGIKVCNTPEAPVNAVAEHAAGLLLCVMKRLCAHDRGMRSGGFKPIGGALLEGKRVGVIGYGRIGKRFSSLMAAFGADVRWFDPHVEGDGKRAGTLEELLEWSDIISLHASLDGAGKRLIGRGELQKCRKGVIIINTARGELIDEEALVWALDSGIVGGAGLDVFEKEPYEGRLTGFDCVVTTPHVSSNVKETRDAMEKEAVANLEKAIAGKATIQPNANYHALGGKSVFSEKMSDPKFAEYRRKWIDNPKGFMVERFPLHLDIETTNVCNLRCPHCAASQDNWAGKGRGVMDFELYKRIIDEGAREGLCSIKFSLRGEPLMHKDIIKMIRYAKEKGIMDMYFNTNGMLLTREMSKNLIDAGLNRISVSADGWEKESFEKNRLGAKFETVVENIRALRKAREEKGADHPKIRIQAVMLPEVKEHLEEYKALWGPLADELGYIDAREEGLGVDHTGLRGEWACPFLWQRMVILWDGTLLPCLLHGVSDFSLMSLGNVKDVSIKGMWNSEKMNRLRELHRKGLSHDIKACDICSYRAKEFEKLGVRK